MTIKVANSFKKEFKKLLKKDKYLLGEYESLINKLELNPTMGVPLGGAKYKIRLKNESNQKGKNSGYRVITYIKTEDTVILVYIYSKSDIENISIKRIDDIILSTNI